MRVSRIQELETSEFMVGDRISILLGNFGEFSATAQKITDAGTLFLFDDCVAEYQMNKKNTSEGGYEESSLCKWINTVLMELFPWYIRNRIGYITIPTYGQIFGHDDLYNRSFEPDDDEMFPSMVRRKNRIADFENDDEWYWLRNALKVKGMDGSFAYVGFHGDVGNCGASHSNGIRPVFLLV
jgi:hypothetical protein